ncbi:class I SAM-dependent DNA methyltransferase [Yoonia vestfoldensis]|uniref:site-specific DNA-methyltransferase (adenine-specific) n=1 Tax=Yoonia vestfoldensis TaxID=245188 RepID=A0A1Y0EE53_9RHOB|nr:DNA methyltransferase [Yoonia vestfoldensis]ARU01897.1 lactate dehydrogenase [Yoonia vestfoldensis]
MNPAEISDALAALAAKPYDPVEFPFEFAAATDNNPATIAKLQNGSFNKSDLPGGVLMNQKFHFAPALNGMTSVTLDALRANKRTLKHKPAILITSDGVEVSAEHLKSGDTLHCAFTELGDRFGFFLPAAGKERYRAAEENPVDIKVAGKLAKLYDALIRRNPDWAAEDRRHDMNQLMTRLIFCLFAEDVGIFPDNQFSRLIFTHAGDKGEGMREVLISAFTAMNTSRDKRDALPAWTREFEYVNGGLFAGAIDAPMFDAPSARYLRDVSAEDWKGINPDIFGSMIQSVTNAELRSELGMHYTSVPNIMKVLGPLFLDELDAEIDRSWDRERALRQVLDRISKIRVFDPACGSGNFLVVAYRALREREITILSRISELTGGTQTEMWSVIPIRNFYGIELTDFAVETAKLALFIAEYQANAQFKEAFGRKPADLPLRDAANVVCGNALRLDWEAVCPVPEDGGEVFIAGNPPFLGSTNQSKEQKADLAHVFAGQVESFAAFDYVAGWFYKVSLYLRGRTARSAFVSTNSLCQGQSVAAFWPHLLRDDLEIGFAHTSFKWRNNASANATVMCVVVGLRNRSGLPARLFSAGVSMDTSNINAYLVPYQNIYIEGTRNGLFSLPPMDYGNKPVEQGHLLLDQAERDDLIRENPGIKKFIRPFMGSNEVVKGTTRYCFWIRDEELLEAREFEEIRIRIGRVEAFRRGSTDAYVREKLLPRSHAFKQVFEAKRHTIAVPIHTGETRPYLPVARFSSDVIFSNAAMALYDAPDWCVAVIASRLHLVWISTVCGKLETRFRYSNTLGWNTFPVPKFTEDQLAALTKSAMAILRCRLTHHPKTIADLYDPDKMPEDLRAAHKANDDLLESMYIGRPFRNDTERLEHLFKLYAARVKKLKKGAA